MSAGQHIHWSTDTGTTSGQPGGCRKPWVTSVPSPSARCSSSSSDCRATSQQLEMVNLSFTSQVAMPMHLLAGIIIPAALSGGWRWAPAHLRANLWKYFRLHAVDLSLSDMLDHQNRELDTPLHVIRACLVSHYQTASGRRLYQGHCSTNKIYHRLKHVRLSESQGML